MEDRRRRGVASEKLATEMLRYLDNSEKVKMDIAELQKLLEVPVQIGISIQQVAQQARSENSQKIFEVFCQEEEEVYVAGQMGCAVERLSGVGKKMSGQKSGNTNAEQKARIV